MSRKRAIAKASERAEARAGERDRRNRERWSFKGVTKEEADSIVAKMKEVGAKVSME